MSQFGHNGTANMVSAFYIPTVANLFLRNGIYWSLKAISTTNLFRLRCTDENNGNVPLPGHAAGLSIASG
jgi:hypothetical protein